MSRKYSRNTVASHRTSLSHLEGLEPRLLLSSGASLASDVTQAQGGLVYDHALIDGNLDLTGRQNVVFGEGVTIHGDLVLADVQTVQFLGSVLVTGSVTVQASTIVLSGSLMAGVGQSVVLSGQTIRDDGLIHVESGRISLTSDVLTSLSAGAVIDVSGVTTGAGSVRLWSDVRTDMAGTILARGGQSGDGGFVEVSSGGAMAMTGQVDTTATAGQGGRLLIDPKNVIIGLIHDDEPGNPGVPLATADADEFSDYPTDTLHVSVATLLTWGSVTIQASNDITVNSAIAMGAGDSLALQAGRSVVINASISTQDQSLSITANDPNAILANRDGGLGTILMSAGTALSAGNGTITLSVSTTNAATAGGITIEQVSSTGTVTLSSGGSILRAASGTTDSIVAGTVNLTANASGATLGASGTNNALIANAGTVNAQTTDGNIYISDDKAGGMTVGTITAGTGLVALWATQGSMLAGPGGSANITAAMAELVTTWAGGSASIGVAGTAIRTAIDLLVASTYDGGIYVDNTGALIIGTAIAHQSVDKDGVALHSGAGTDVSKTAYPGGSGPIVLSGSGLVGTYDVTIHGTGDIVLESAVAPNVVTISTTGGAIYNGAGSNNALIAQTVSFQATGDIGQSANPILNTVQTLQASSSGGSVYLTEGQGTTLGSVLADADAVITTSAGTFSVQTVTAGGDVTLSTSNGSILNGGGIITASSASLSATNAIGASGNSLPTDVDDLSASVSAQGAPIYMANSSALSSVSATTKAGSVAISYTGGSLAFTPSNSLLTVSAGPAVAFDNTGGNLVIGTLDAGAAAVSLTASGGITAQNGAVTLTAGDISLAAGSSVGASGSPIHTVASASLTGTAAAGGIYISQAGAFTLTASASGAGNDIDVVNTTGDMTLKKVSAPDQVSLNTGGSILNGSTDSTANILAASATLTASGAIGASGNPLLMAMGTLVSASAAGGGVFLFNSGSLQVTSVTAGGDVSVSTIGALTVGTVSAAGQSVALGASRTILDGNGAAGNITADSLSFIGGSVGMSGDPMETTVASLRASTTAGGVYVVNTGTLALGPVTALGAGSNVIVETTGSMNLGEVLARGNDVTLTSDAGAITKAGGSGVNVTARTLTIAAATGIGAAGSPLSLDVDKLDASGGAGGVSTVNAGALALTSTSFVGKGAANLTFDAQSITVLDNSGAVMDIGVDGSVQMNTTTGDIVFLNVTDTIRTHGLGTITIHAGTTLGSGAVAVLGNLTTANQAITVTADGNVILGGTLDGGSGHVTISSHSGVILGNSGLLVNIVAGTLTLDATTPTPRQAQLITDWAIADATAARAEAAAKQTSADSFASMVPILLASKDAAQTNHSLDVPAVAAAQSKADASAATADALQIAATVLNGVAMAATLVKDIATIPECVAQAVPLTGDGGAATAWGIVAVIADSIGLASYALGVAANEAAGTAAEDALSLASYQAQEYADQHILDLATANWSSVVSASNIATAASIKAAVARDTAAVVAQWQILSEDQGNAIGSLSGSLKLDVDSLNTTVTSGGIYITVPGDYTLDTMTATGPIVVESATGSITVAGTVTSPARVTLDADQSIFEGAGGRVVAPEFAAEAGAGIGDTGAILTTVSKFAAAGGTGGINIDNTGALTVDTLGGVAGVTATGDITISATGALTLQAPIDPPGQTVTLTSGGSITGASSGVPDVTAGTLMADAAGGIQLDTDITTLIATTSAAGAIHIENAGPLTVTNAQTANGPIFLSAGGVMTVTSARSLTDADANDIELLSHGSLLLGAVDTGGVNGDVTADTGATVGASITMSGGGRITSDRLTATADGTLHLTTTVHSADLESEGAGDVNVSEADDISLVRAIADDGAIDVTAGGTITATDVESLTDNGGTAVTLTSMGGNILLGTVTAGQTAAAVQLTASGTLSTLAGGRVTAFSLDSAAGGATTLVTTVADLTTTTSGAGAVSVTESDAITVDITSANGPVTVQAVGDIDATVVSQTGVDANDIALTSTAGDLRSHGINAGASGDVNLNAPNGSISNAAGVVAGDVLTAGAADGITLSTALNSVVAQVSSAGNLTLTEADNLALTNLLTTLGDVSVTSTAGSLAANSVDAGGGDDNVTLTASAGSITESGNDAGADIVGNQILLVSGTGIASSPNPLEIDGTLLAGIGGTGGVFLEDLAGGLTLGTIGLYAGVTAGGAVQVTTHSPLTVNASVTSTGSDITLTALGSSGNDDLTVNANLAAGAGRQVALTSGDDVILAASAAIIVSGGAVAIQADTGDADVAGGQVLLQGAITAGSMSITTENGDDTIVVDHATLGAFDVTTNGGSDTVTASSGCTLGTGTIDLGSGNDALLLSSRAADVALGTGSDQVTLKAGGGIEGTLDGGSGIDRLLYQHAGLADDYVGAVSFNHTTGTATDVAGWTSLEYAQSTDNPLDTLTGPAAASSWHVTGANAGDIGGSGAFSFVGFGNLAGGAGNDTFQFASGGGLSGGLSGGGGQNTIDYNALHDGQASVTLSSSNAGTASDIGGQFDSIRTVVGDSLTIAQNTITGSPTSVTWQFSTPSSGNIDGTFFFDNFGAAHSANNGGGGGGGGTLDFSASTGDTLWHITDDNAGIVTTDDGAFAFTGMSLLVGGAGTDTFAFDDGKVVTDGVDGGAGNDYIDLVAYTSENIWSRSGPDGTIETHFGTFAYDSVENIRGGLVTYFRYQMLDLKGSFTRLTLPSTLIGHGSGRVNFAFTNNSNARVKDHFTVNFFLSTDDLASAGDVLIGSLTDVSIDLLSGKTKALRTGLTVPEGTPAGQYHLLATLRSTSTPEDNQFNNVVAYNGMIGVTASAPDLTAEVTRMALPANGVAGDSGKVAVKITNTGNVNIKAPFGVGLYLSSDTSIDGSDTLLRQKDNYPVDLRPGQSVTWTTNVTTPADVTPGTYHVLARVNANPQIVETDVVNNDAASATTTTLAAPEVVLALDSGDVHLPSTAVPGDFATFHVTLANHGNTSGTETVGLRVYASVDDTLDGSDVQVASLDNRVLRLASGGTHTFTMTSMLRDSLLPATYHWLVAIDGGNATVEGGADHVLTAQSTELVWKFGNFNGRRLTPLRLGDSAGKPVLFTLRGNGCGSVIGGATLDEIVMVGTTKWTQVRMIPLTSSHRPQATVTAITVRQPLRSFYAPGLEVTGPIELDAVVGRFVIYNPPAVRVAAVDDQAAEPSGGLADTGLFRVSRSTTSGDLAVKFSLKGSAVRDTDYQLSVGGLPLVGNSVVIPDGQDHVDVLLTPLSDSRPESAERAVLKLQRGPIYAIDRSAGLATVDILASV